jgi:hypothetical protein
VKTIISAAADTPGEGNTVTARFRAVTNGSALTSMEAIDMRHMLMAVLLTTVGFSSAASGAVAPPPIDAIDQFSVSGIKVDATGESPRAARDLAMVQGRPLAWRNLFRRFAGQRDWGREPQLAETELLRLILRSEAANIRRNTTRYLADVTFHFDPAAVRQLLHRSNIIFTEAPIDAAGEWDESVDHQISAIEDASTHLAVNVRFDTPKDWTTLRARLDAAEGVTSMEVVGRTLHEAQIYLAYSGEVEQLQDTLAQHALELTSSEGQYTLELDAAKAAPSPSS